MEIVRLFFSKKFWTPFLFITITMFFGTAVVVATVLLFKMLGDIFK